MKNSPAGNSLLSNPFLNKGTAFTEKERDNYNLTGTLPNKIEKIEEQSNRVYAQFLTKQTNLEKRSYLMEIFNTNCTLFYFLMKKHIVEFMPIVYDPTVAESIEKYSELFISPQNAAFLSINHPNLIRKTLKNAAQGRDIKLIVVTDAEEILGIGDWGVNGVDICVGKLMVYTAAAGIPPENVLPVVLDTGTNNKKLLNDALYLGERHARVRGPKYNTFVDLFVENAEALFPDLYLHWEDFGRANATAILERYKNKITTFNDDVQGTGIVSLAGILGALKISGEKITDQILVTFGAGTAGVGIANQIYDEMVRQGLSESDAKRRIFLVDKQGLLFTDTPDLTFEQKKFARDRGAFSGAESLTSLSAVVQQVKPTVLIGTSTQPSSFTEELVKEMASYTKRPIIFPLSNPTELAEATASDLIKWTNGKALVATGVPSEPVEHNGITYQIGQANNALMYPGLGLGILASTAKLINGEILSKASHALSGLVDYKQLGAAVLPPVKDITHISDRIAKKVIESVLEQKLNKKTITSAEDAIKAIKWTPEYV